MLPDEVKKMVKRANLDMNVIVTSLEVMKINAKVAEIHASKQLTQNFHQHSPTQLTQSSNINQKAKGKLFKQNKQVIFRDDSPESQEASIHALNMRLVQQQMEEDLRNPFPQPTKPKPLVRASKDLEDTNIFHRVGKILYNKRRL